MNNLETLLDKEIEDEFSGLSGVELGTDTYKTMVDGLTRLCDRKIEIEKVKADQKIKAEQAKNENKHKIIGHILTGAGIIIPAAITVWGTVKSINFEKEGTFTTIMGRGFVQKMLPKK